MHDKRAKSQDANTEVAEVEAGALTVPLEDGDEFWWHDAHDGWSGIRKRAPSEAPPPSSSTSNGAPAKRENEHEGA